MQRRGLACLVAALIALALTGVFPVTGSGHVAWADAAPKVDGNLGEWEGVAKQASTDPEVSYWQIAKDAQGNVYLALSGTGSTQWSDWQWKTLDVTINGTRTTSQFSHLPSGGGASWDPVKGSFAQVNQANGNTAGPMYAEIELDASSFGGSTDYSIAFAGTTVAAADIPAFGGSSSGDEPATPADPGTATPGQPATPGETTDPTQPSDPSSSGGASGDPATYNGITIDGNFSDWDAIQKTEASDPNPQHPQNLAAAALVFDHDYVYIYVQEGRGGSAAGAGTHSNGQFSITTDLGTGNELLVQLHEDQQGNSSVTAGDQTVDSRHVGSQWEIAVPKSMLPNYQRTINFGLYQQEPIVSNVANLDTTDSGNAGDFNGITYDGKFDDWAAYPHKRIQYATAGTQEHVADASAAIYASNGTLFSHAKTTMPEHLSEGGGEFLQAVDYDFGGKQFYPSFGTVDSNGIVHLWHPGQPLEDGTELYVFDAQGWGVDGVSLASLQADDALKTHGNAAYGRITVSVKSGQVDEMESEIDLATVAKKFNCDANDFKTIKAQFGRLGQEWVETAGTSTAPWLGTALAVASVLVVCGIAYAVRQKRNAGDAPGLAPKALGRRAE